MANHKSAKKRVKQTICKTERNKAQTSEVKTAIKAIRAAIASNDKEVATSLLPQTQRLLRKLAKTGVIKANSAARKTSRLARQVNRL